MIVLSNSALNAKMTFESEIGKEGVSILKSHEGVTYGEIYIDKDEAFDWIQLLLTQGWKQGE